MEIMEFFISLKRLFMLFCRGNQRIQRCTSAPWSSAEMLYELYVPWIWDCRWQRWISYGKSEDQITTIDAWFCIPIVGRLFQCTHRWRDTMRSSSFVAHVLERSWSNCMYRIIAFFYHSHVIICQFFSFFSRIISWFNCFLRSFDTMFRAWACC